MAYAPTQINQFRQGLMRAGGGNALAGLQQQGRQNQLANLMSQAQLKGQTQQNELNALTNPYLIAQQRQKAMREQAGYGGTPQLITKNGITYQMKTDPSTGRVTPVPVGPAGGMGGSGQGGATPGILPNAGSGSFNQQPPPKIPTHLQKFMDVSKVASGTYGIQDLIAAAELYKADAAESKTGGAGADYIPSSFETNREGTTTGINKKTGQKELVPETEEVKVYKKNEWDKYVVSQQEKHEELSSTIAEAIAGIDSQKDNTFDTSGGTLAAIGQHAPFMEESFSLNQDIDMIKANLAFDALQRMREASKTGGALGAISERELAALERSVKSLDAGLQPSKKRKNLIEVQEHYNNFIKSIGGTPTELPGADPRKEAGESKTIGRFSIRPI